MANVDNDTFQFFLPATVVKAGKTDDGKRWIQGIASTDALDLQGEKVAQKGIDFEYFLKNGYINDDHKQGPEYKVGEPTEAKITKDGFWIKGFLYKGKDRADQWWNHLTSLDKSDSKRKVGFSIEGKVQRRNGKEIVKCWIKDVAITASPVNTSTWAEIAKSLCAEPWCDPIGKAQDHECAPGCDGNCDHKEKALSTSGSGAPMQVEDLEGSAKVQTYKSLKEIPAGAQLSKSDCVRVLQLDKGWSRATAEAVVDAIFTERKINI